jgi:hypothetical protein
MKHTSNYQALCEMWRIKILELDRNKIRRHICVDMSGSDYVQLRYFNADYRVDLNTGKITLMVAPETPLGFYTQMAIYHLFYFTKADAHIHHDWVPFRQVKGAAPFDPAFQKMIIQPLAAVFSGKAEALAHACIQLGGQKGNKGDVDYTVKAFSVMPLRLIFWDGDDEFPAQVNMLFDSSITDFTHEETVVGIAEDFAERLMRIAGETGSVPYNTVDPTLQ